MGNFEDYLIKYDLKEADIHLLDLIPLIEMIWVDNENQNAEIDILYRFALDHLCNLEDKDGNTPITENDVNSFLDRFTQKQPEAQMLKDLRELCIDQLGAQTDQSEQKSRKDAILDHCLDIAGACAAAYPYKYNERVAISEKTLIKELFRKLA
ncbi:MAG: hypothetical protein ACI9FB_002160 [Candidatus Azotimanducaceae bacterium]|jgi:hypothetical protein